MLVVSLVLAFCAGWLPVLALPTSPPSLKRSIHRSHIVSSNASYDFYHPQPTFETFGTESAASLLPRGSPEEAAVAFIHTKLQPFQGAVNLKTTRSYARDGVHHVYVHQEINGIQVSNGVGNVAMKGNNALSYGHNFVQPTSVSYPTPIIPKLDAIKFAENALGGTYNDHPTKLEYVITNTHSAVLAYVIQIQSPEHWYEAFVSATSSSPSIVNLIDFTAHAAYRALPFTVQYPTPSAFQLIQNPQDLSASPNGWHADTSSYTTTRGNNVIAMHGGVATPQTSSPLVFDYTWDPSSSPTSAVNANAATVNAFYIGNTVHDIMYKYGFTEPAFNFQNTNFGKGGAGNDGVTVMAQASGTSSTYDSFSTPPDGQRPVCKISVWSLTSPGRDGDLENDIITHEFTHGTTNRLTGGGTARCLQTTEAAGLGEGWSDSFAFWSELSGTAPTDWTFGAWVSNTPGGLRHYPYSTSMSTNSRTYGDLQTLNEVHDIGEVWGEILFEVYWALVAALGYSSAKADPSGSAGNIVFLHLWTDALAIQPCNPTFVNARDAIIQADANRYNASNKCTLWRAFAKRGLGSGAANHANSFTVPAGC